MNRWLILIVIGAVVLSGINGCVLVVADDDVAHEVREKEHRSRLARSIQRDIESEDALGGSDISVSERDGQVTLSGHVDSLTALSRAIAIAVDRAGVRNLGLRLEVIADP